MTRGGYQPKNLLSTKPQPPNRGSNVIKSNAEKIKENKTMKEEKYYIVRGNNSGVFFGHIKERNGTEVTMTDVRRLWYWDGAASLSQLAQYGTSNPNQCKFSVAVDEVLILDTIEIDTCTSESVKCIQGVKEWRA